MNKEKLLDECEVMTLVCTKACTYWSLVKLCFNIPLVVTSSAMCIINSISNDANSMKIPNIKVNAIRVLIMSLNNSVKASEKIFSKKCFERLSQPFMILSQEIEGMDKSMIKKSMSSYS